jgi:hypothetical protein
VKVGATRIVDIPTGGSPQEALAAAALEFVDGPHVVELSVGHDEGCPCTSGAGMPSCTCEIVTLEGTRIA